LIRLSVDFECPSSDWWEGGGRELWQSITEGFDGSSVVLDDGLAESWLDQARLVPGWHGGPEYAPHPISSSPIGEDEEFI